MSQSHAGATLWSGFEVHVEDSGEGAPVVLFHSSGMSGEQWRRTTSALLHCGLRTVVPDLLGSGRSAPWPDGKPFGFALDVEVAGRLLQQIGRPAHLVGHSYGGHIALRAAALAPERVLSLALYDPVAFGVLDREADADAFAEMSRLDEPFGKAEADRAAWLQSFVEYWGGPEAWSRLREPARAEMARVGWVVHSGAMSLVADRTGSEAYRSITVTTLLVTGERSPIAARRIVAHLGGAIAGADVHQLAGAGHMGPLTHLEAWNQLLAAHLAAAQG
jgi:pimeloyl-ACP methyl ester carboxylesterase